MKAVKREGKNTLYTALFVALYRSFVVFVFWLVLKLVFMLFQ